MEKKFIKIGLISISDRASAGIYKDEGIPSLTDWLTKALINEFELETALINDDIETVKKTLISFTDEKHCDLVFTTGGTGPPLETLRPRQH